MESGMVRRELHRWCLGSDQIIPLFGSLFVQMHLLDIDIYESMCCSCWDIE
jgi:hypothetical protein